MDRNNGFARVNDVLMQTGNTNDGMRRSGIDRVMFETDEFMWKLTSLFPPLICLLVFLLILLVITSSILYCMLQLAWKRTCPRKNEDDWVDIKKRVIFIHPDLGVGGAERLVVDAASELVSRGYVVNIYTAFHSADRCFAETLSGQFGVHVYGDWFPRHICGKFHVLCAYMRTLIAAIHALVEEGKDHADESVFFVDQVSFVVPLLRAAGASVAFYCHFPDLLLAERTSLIKQLYRFPIDFVEELTTCFSSIIMVNSEFTLSVFRSTFTWCFTDNCPTPKVVYPAVDTSSIRYTEPQQMLQPHMLSTLPDPAKNFPANGPLFVSLNRFERKKSVETVIVALSEMKNNEEASIEAKSATLIIAGGYDSRQKENIDYLKELRQLALAHGVEDRVAFLPNFSSEEREKLFNLCTGVVYTPPNEHFGIVPLEAMASGRPVIACDSGGPRESVLHGTTGYLCQPTAHGFAEAMTRLADAPIAKRIEMGKAARRHIEENFSRSKLGDNVEDVIKPLFVNTENEF